MFVLALTDLCAVADPAIPPAECTRSHPLQILLEFHCACLSVKVTCFVCPAKPPKLV